jgi:hypothetical protein
MTAWRHGRKALLALVVSLTVAAVGGAMVGTVLATTTERLVVDRTSGLAIYGFDPVAYFSESKPVQGLEAFELIFEGAVWRFRNAGDRAAFIADPDVYAPQFGGYDPLYVAGGRTVAGHPEIWLVRAQRLYLFSTEKSRADFIRTAPSLLVDAWQRWPALRDKLPE